MLPAVILHGRRFFEVTFRKNAVSVFASVQICIKSRLRAVRMHDFAHFRSLLLGHFVVK